MSDFVQQVLSHLAVTQAFSDRARPSALARPRLSPRGCVRERFRNRQPSCRSVEKGRQVTRLDDATQVTLPASPPVTVALSAAPAVTASAKPDEAWPDPIHPRLGRSTLVFESSPAARKALLDSLRKLGIPTDETAIATTLEEAFHSFTADAPRLVFMELPDAAGGIEALEEMLARRPEARVVLVTAESCDSPGVRRAVRAGVFALVEKPLRSDRLRQVLNELEAEESSIERLR